ncbi:hypothetical protein ACJJTC_016901 [Scirpophaga incertulas]
MRGSVSRAGGGCSIDLSKGTGSRALSQLTAVILNVRFSPRSRSERSRVIISPFVLKQKSQWPPTPNSNMSSSTKLAMEKTGVVRSKLACHVVLLAYSKEVCDYSRRTDRRAPTPLRRSIFKNPLNTNKGQEFDLETPHFMQDIQ